MKLYFTESNAIVIKQIMITRSKQHAIVQQVLVPQVLVPQVLVPQVLVPQVLVSQVQLQRLPFEPIDFDLASDCWRANKMSIGNGMFKYVCPFMKIDNTRCGRNVKKGCMSCRYH
jgi:hypothetical protein